MNTKKQRLTQNGEYISQENAKMLFYWKTGIAIRKRTIYSWIVKDEIRGVKAGKEYVIHAGDFQKQIELYQRPKGYLSVREISKMFGATPFRIKSWVDKYYIHDWRELRNGIGNKKEWLIPRHIAFECGAALWSSPPLHDIKDAMDNVKGSLTWRELSSLIGIDISYLHRVYNGISECSARLWVLLMQYSGADYE